MNSAKRFDMVRTVFSVLIALAISFVIIFLVSDQPLEAIKYLLIGPFTNKRSMGNVVESMIPLITLDNLVRPSPDNAPTVISSMDIKTSLNPIMTR